MDWLFSYDIWAAFLTLTILEIVLGVDNVVFISILTSKLPKHQQPKARVFGLSLAMVARIALLLSLSWVMGLTDDLFRVFELGVSGRDLILFFGGLFLMFKATREIHNSLAEEQTSTGVLREVGFLGVLVQIAVIDMVFSLDSVITAVGLVDQIPVMVAAIVVAIIIMMAAAGAISEFVDRHPPIKMLALSFLVLIGFVLMGESFGMHVPKAYIYFSLFFAFVVELLNITVTKRKPLKLERAQMSWAVAGVKVREATAEN